MYRGTYGGHGLVDGRSKPKRARKGRTEQRSGLEKEKGEGGLR